MKINLIVAVGNQGQIGKDNRLLWNIPEDLKNFKKLTDGGILVMGRKTFESLPGLLPNRFHYVLTKEKGKQHESPFVKYIDVIDLMINDLVDELTDELWVIGGEQIYKKMLPRADKLYISEVDYNGEADAYFHFNKNGWDLVQEIEHPAIIKDEHVIVPKWTFKEYERGWKY